MPLSDLASAVLALAAVIGLILLLRVGGQFLGRKRPRVANGPFALEGQFGIDSKRRLLLLRCGEARLLLLTGGPTDVMLPWPNAGAETKS